MVGGSADDQWDTLLSVPRRDWSAAFFLRLNLEGQELGLEQLSDELLDDTVLAALDEAIDLARPSEWTARQTRQGLAFLRDRDYVLAWPLLVTSVEGLYWEEAESKGLIDPATGRITEGELVGRTARDAHDVFRVLPINERVRKTLSRYAFGSEANAFRHGRRGAWGERQQCAIWLLALTAWFDGAGWRHFDPQAFDPPR